MVALRGSAGRVEHGSLFSNPAQPKPKILNPPQPAAVLDREICEQGMAHREQISPPWIEARKAESVSWVAEEGAQCPSPAAKDMGSAL